MSTKPPLDRPLTGLRYGDPVEIHLEGLEEPATATYVGYAGGYVAMVKLDGTGQLISVPRRLIHRP